MAHDVPTHRVNTSDSRTTPLEPPDPHTLHSSASWVLTTSMLLALASVIVGISLLIDTTSADSGFVTETSHPYTNLGIAVLAAGIIQALIIGMLAQWAMLYAKIAATRQ